MRESLYGKTLEQLKAVAAEADLPPYAGRQLADWIYAKDAESFDAMDNLPRRARVFLAERYALEPRRHLQVAQSTDGTRKYLFPAGEEGFVEAAFIPEGSRSTLCLSVQVGCKMGCLFCMTGKQGFHGNLSPGEILGQYRNLPERRSLTNIVYMGMGEPLDNLLAVMASLEILCSPYGYGMSPARVTVSTVGLIPGMKSFLEESQCHLAVSLHSPFEEERRKLMPVEHVYPLSEVLALLRQSTLEGRRRVSFEYIMFDGVNDTPRHARELVRILAGIRCRVNLIPFHPIPGSPLRPAPRDVMEKFQGLLKSSGVLTTIRQSRGLDISAACGMLSTRELVRRKAGAGLDA
jgi:23S rRNA (adenine2503-C2)-methyltransferase